MINVETKTGVYTRGEEEIKFDFKTSISARDKIKFVNSVTETLVDDKKSIVESGSGNKKTITETTEKNYHYIIKDLVFDFYLVEIFTDIDTTEVTEETYDVIGAMEKFVGETNIVKIVEEFNEELIAELRKAVELNIEYRTGIHKNPIAESLSSLLNTVEKKVADFDVNAMMDVAQALSGVSGELTAKKMLEAYANSDAMKERYTKLLVGSDK